MQTTQGGALNGERTKEVFFICTFDPFGRGLHIYHFENLCREDPTIRLNDGTEKIFLNTRAIIEADASSDGLDEDLRNLLKYFESRTPGDAYTEELDKAVAAAKKHREWRREYMKMRAWEWDIRREEREEGRAEGKLEGLVSLVYRKAIKGKAPEKIAEDLEEELSEVRRIYDVVVKYLPDYEPEKILAELNVKECVQKASTSK